MDKNGKINITDSLGNKVECDVLFTFDSDEMGKSYIVYTDNTLDELGNIKVYANTYDSYSDTGELGTIDSEEEWKVIEKIFDSLKENKE